MMSLLVIVVNRPLMDYTKVLGKSVTHDMDNFMHDTIRSVAWLCHIIQNFN